jgi:outer membrane lipoprotein SlyB
MFNAMKEVKVIAVVVLLSGSGAAWAQTSVNYGRITSVNMVTESSSNAQTGGALVGGALGLISGSGQSGSNRALRSIGGAAVGSQVGRVASRSQSFEYTILIDGRTTVTMVTEKAGMRVGDCVAVERGGLNNLRLVDDARCASRPAQPAAKSAPPAAPAAPAVSPTAQREADACVTAKEQLLNTDTDEAFDRAYRRVRLLCGG